MGWHLSSSSTRWTSTLWSTSTGHALRMEYRVTWRLPLMWYSPAACYRLRIIFCSCLVVAQLSKMNISSIHITEVKLVYALSNLQSRYFQIFMLVYDAIYIGFSSPKTLFALIMVVFIITIYYYECWTHFVRFEIND